MGHYVDVKFSAHLTDLGSAIIEKLYETRDWKQTAEFFTEHKFVEEFIGAFERTGWVPIPFAEGKHAYYRKTGVWNVAVCFKDRGPGDFRELLESFLAAIVSGPTALHVSHELWNTPYQATIAPRQPPTPDWDRQYGD